MTISAASHPSIPACFLLRVPGIRTFIYSSSLVTMVSVSVAAGHRNTLTRYLGFPSCRARPQVGLPCRHPGSSSCHNRDVVDVNVAPARVMGCTSFAAGSLALASITMDVCHVVSRRCYLMPQCAPAAGSNVSRISPTANPIREARTSIQASSSTFLPSKATRAVTVTEQAVIKYSRDGNCKPAKYNVLAYTHAYLAHEHPPRRASCDRDRAHDSREEETLGRWKSGRRLHTLRQRPSRWASSSSARSDPKGRGPLSRDDARICRTSLCRKCVAACTQASPSASSASDR